MIFFMMLCARVSGSEPMEVGVACSTVCNSVDSPVRVDDVVVSNPPFSKKRLVVLTLLRRKKPFVLLLRVSVLFTQWFRRLLPKVKLVFPSRRVDFDGGADGKKLAFDCVFVCHDCGPRSSLFMCPFRG